MAESLSPELALVDPELAERARAELADGDSSPSAPQPEPPGRARRARGRWAAVVVALLLAAGLGVGAVWQRYDDGGSGSRAAHGPATPPSGAEDPAPSRREASRGPVPHRPLRPPLRPPAFHVPGAPKEPLDEIALPVRARRLEAWLTSRRALDRANLRHWLYQHAWIVSGARFGWWQGAAALRILIRVDRRVESRWGVGYRSEALARRALAEVESKGR
jgi:hypothetical protein